MAFSLIELSIVLIIIGLLAAGVTGGVSLIRSAKLQSTINDMGSLKRSFFIFYAAKNRVPGDLNGDGCIGYCYKEGSFSTESTYTTFKNEYSGKSVNYFAGPFVDMYLEGVIDFKPDLSAVNVSRDSAMPGKRSPIVKGFENAMFNDFHTFIHYSATAKNNASHSFYNMKDGYYQRIKNYGSGYLDPKFVFGLERKLDDGEPNAGALRSGCVSITGAGTSYQDLIDNKKIVLICFIL